MHGPSDEDDYGEEKLEGEEEENLTREEIIEEEIIRLIEMGRGVGLMGEDIQRVLTRCLNREKDRNQDKWSPY